MTMRVLMVDDEPPVRRGLQRILARDPDIVVAGEAADGAEAVTFIKSAKPDLVFLDVRMPEMNGFEVLEALDDDERPAVVFVTAFDEYAVQAFEVHAVDYVLKPFDDDRVMEAVARARQRLNPAASTDALTELLRDVNRERPYLDRIAAPGANSVVLVPVESIDWCGAADNYVKLHCGSQRHLVRSTIRGLAARLDPKRFVRIHRSTIVNLDRVERLESTESGEYRVYLVGEAVLTLSRGYRDAFKHATGWRMG